MSQDQYDCTFKICANGSLQIMVKDRKSKRKFSAVFNKPKLESINIDYTPNKMYSILQTAKDAKKNNLKNWKFLIKYTKANDSIDENKLNATNTLFSYQPGDKMVVLLNINEPRFYMKSAFKLYEVPLAKKPILPQSITTSNSFPFINSTNPTAKIRSSRSNSPNRNKNKLSNHNHNNPQIFHSHSHGHPQRKSPKISRKSSVSSPKQPSLSPRDPLMMAPQTYPTLNTPSKHPMTPKDRKSSPRMSLYATQTHTKRQHGSMANSAHNHTRKSSRSPRQNAKFPKRKSTSHKKEKRKNAEDVLCLLNSEDTRIHSLEQQIRLLEKDNDHLLNKIKDITATSPTSATPSITPSILHQNSSDQYWLKQKIEKVEKNLDMKILKNAGFQFNSPKDNESCDWKDVLNVSFNIISKLAKQIHLKEDQYDQLTNKWIAIKKENKDIKKSKTGMEMTIERQKSMLKENEQQLKDKDKKIGLLKDNQRNIGDKMRKMEREMNIRFDEYDNKLQKFNEEKIRAHSKLNEAKKEIKQNKIDYDEIMKQCGVLQEENDKLLNDVEKLRYFLSETNRKSLQLMECINNSKLIMDNLGYNVGATTHAAPTNMDCSNSSNSTNSNGSGNDQSNLSSDISLTMTYSKGRFPAGDTSQNFV